MQHHLVNLLFKEGVYEALEAVETFSQPEDRGLELSEPEVAEHRSSKLTLDWSPEQISGWLKTRYPDDESMRVSHETIYRSLFIQAQRDLVAFMSASLRSAACRSGMSPRWRSATGIQREKRADGPHADKARPSYPWPLARFCSGSFGFPPQSKETRIFLNLDGFSLQERNAPPASSRGTIRLTA